jgi:hypothetical protein
LLPKNRKRKTIKTTAASSQPQRRNRRRLSKVVKF